MGEGEVEGEGEGVGEGDRSDSATVATPIHGSVRICTPSEKCLPSVRLAR